MARALIESQFPELIPAAVSLAGRGWDNVVYRVNGDWFFRFPVRQAAVDGVHREIACLPRLATQVPGVSAPHFIGRPTEAFPRPFFGFRPVPGREACEAALSTDQRRRLARALGRFLRTLHRRELCADYAALLPGDIWGRLDMARRIPMIRERHARCRAKYGPECPIGEAELGSVLEPATSGIRLEATAVVHGDFHFRHVIVDERGEFSGAIDWGDLHLGNPAVDLQIAWGMFSPEVRLEFWDEYGEVSAEQRAQSRVIALFLALTLFEYGSDEGLDAVRREARLALGHLMQG